MGSMASLTTTVDRNSNNNRIMNGGTDRIPPKKGQSYYVQYKLQKELQNPKRGCVGILAVGSDRVCKTANPDVISRNIHMRYKKTTTNK